VQNRKVSRIDVSEGYLTRICHLVEGELRPAGIDVVDEWRDSDLRMPEKQTLRTGVAFVKCSRVLLQHSGSGKDIVIDEKNTVEARRANTGVAGSRRSTIGECDDREDAWRRNGLMLEHGRGAVRRAVIDNNDFAFRNSIKAEQVGKCPL
jgi:hypothetical protein